MKRIVLWIFAAALLLSMVSCQNEIKLERSPYSEEDFDTTGEVALTIEYPVYDRSVTSYTYSVVNNTDETVTFGREYSIEMLSDGEWKLLPQLEEGVDWPSDASVVAPGETVSNSFSFWPYDFSVVEGTYRLIKTVTLGDGEARLLCQEFSIGESSISSDTPYGYTTLEELPEEIDLETFDCDLATDSVGTIIAGSQERVATFLDKVGQGVSTMMRLVSLTREGDPVIYDVIYENNHFLYRMDQTRDQYAESGEAAQGIYEQRYSYLVTDGEYLYLSDYASLDYQYLDSRRLEAGSTVILCLDNFADGASLGNKVAEITDQRIATNSAMARYWSEDGTYWVDLTAEANSFSVSTKSYGVVRTLPAQAGENPQIYTAQWISADRVQLMFTDGEGNTTYRAVYDVPSESIVFIEERG